MGIVYLAFAIIVVPILFFMATWAMVTAYRLLFPEKPQPFVRDVTYLRRRTPSKKAEVLVGVREIREDQRRYRDTYLCRETYHYVCGTSAGLPEAWQEDVSLRRN